VIGWHLSPGLRRRVGYPAFFAWGLYELEPHGDLYAIHREGALAAVGAWAPPGGTARSGPEARAAAGIVRLLYPHRARTLFAGFAGMTRFHPPQPHWYLAFVGVDPGLQGRGLGAEVLRPVLDRADAEGTLCYLETPFRQTHGFYGRLGFELTRELQPDETPFEAPAPVWTMSRSPTAYRGAASHSAFT
jgi:GNAT superfamily N-acetyltransferase